MIIEIKSCRTCPICKLSRSVQGDDSCEMYGNPMKWEYDDPAKAPDYVPSDCPLRKHEVKHKKEGDE